MIANALLVKVESIRKSDKTTNAILQHILGMEYFNMTASK
jgi:hypothetical protein